MDKLFHYLFLQTVHNIIISVNCKILVNKFNSVFFLVNIEYTLDIESLLVSAKFLIRLPKKEIINSTI